MNPKLAMMLELLLIGLYLALVLVVFDTGTTLGLIEVGVATLVIFPAVLVIEKKREASQKASEEGVDEFSGESTTAAEPVTAQPVDGTQPTLAQPAAQATVQPASQPVAEAPAQPPAQPAGPSAQPPAQPPQ